MLAKSMDLSCSLCVIPGGNHFSKDSFYHEKAHKIAVAH